jgi:cytochrome c biogenesis protein CcdA/thiol-disulfide isomerase/thioredoxin
MAVLLAFAFLSGVITILSPCILPVLPILLSGSLGKGRARPYGLIAGFVLSFTLFTLALSAIVQALGIPADALRYAAVALILVFGLVLLVPRLAALFELGAARVAALGQGSAKPGAAGKKAGFWGGLAVGLSLGLVWTPCVGPIMASVISLALTSRVDGGSVFITLAYSLGTAIPMLAIMQGGRALLARVPLLTRHAAGIQRGFGVVMIALALAIGLGFDRRIQSAILEALPSYGAGLTKLEQAAPVQEALRARGAERAGAKGGAGAGAAVGAAGYFSGAPAGVADDGKLGDYGLAPDFVAGGSWFNAPPSGLRLADLRGKVVLVDFWTYSCVNCVRTLPYLRAWYDAYKDKGLVIVGVHSPEFEFEKVSANVSQATAQLGVTWPVVQDNDYRTWTAYGNQYWPAHYFIDAKGRVRYFHFGEGGYELSERVIQALLKEAGAETGGLVSKPDAQLDDQTPETYLGYERGQGLVSGVKPEGDKAVDYRPGRALAPGEWNLEGRWTIASQFIAPESGGALDLRFNAKSVYLVVESGSGGGSIEARVDGSPAADTPDVIKGIARPAESRLYQLVNLPSGGEHLLRLVVKGRLRLFAFTFG